MKDIQISGYEYCLQKDLEEALRSLADDSDNGWIDGCGCYHCPEGYHVEIPNVTIKIIGCKKECTLEEAEEGLLRQYMGDLTCDGSEFYYSEVTYDGFRLDTLTIGNHDILNIINSIFCDGMEYMHITLTQNDGHSTRL